MARHETRAARLGTAHANPQRRQAGGATKWSVWCTMLPQPLRQGLSSQAAGCGAGAGAHTWNSLGPPSGLSSRMSEWHRQMLVQKSTTWWPSAVLPSSQSWRCPAEQHRLPPQVCHLPELTHCRPSQHASSISWPSPGHAASPSRSLRMCTPTRCAAGAPSWRRVICDAQRPC